MKKEFDYKTNIYCKTHVTVVAENKKEADRILSDTLESVEEKFKDLFMDCECVEVKSNQVLKSFSKIDRNKVVAR